MSSEGGEGAKAPGTSQEMLELLIAAEAPGKPDASFPFAAFASFARHSFRNAVARFTALRYSLRRVA